MTIKPTELLSKKIPEIVNAAFAEMKASGDAGDADAKQRHGDLPSYPGAGRVVLEGKGGTDLYLVAEGTSFRADPKAPSVPVLLAIAAPNEAFELLLEELEGQLDAGLARLQKRLVRLAPKRLHALLTKVAGEKLNFHVVIKDTPDFEEVRIKIATGSATPPEKPTFTVGIDYAVIEALRARKLKPQQLMSKLQLSGDSARAMQFGMELMQRRGS
ncbi:MAG: hypothetical protein JWN48_2096 [Myxococcaceae bacterium]|nr:hypothetical protein [Myxococcaceae bacterium]